MRAKDRAEDGANLHGRAKLRGDAAGLARGGRDDAARHRS